jgi:hypothetical protein
MKLITTSRLGELLGLETKQIHTYHQRGKINFVKQGNKNFIDLEDSTNEIFITSFAQKKGNVIRVKDIKPEEIEKAQRKAKPVAKVNDKERKKAKPIDRILKPVTEYDQHRTEKMKQDAELAKLRLLQMTGRVVPLDQAQMLFSLHFANVSTEFYNAIDNYTVIVVDKLNGSRKDLSEFRSKLKDIVNKAVESAKEKTRTDLQSKADEYAKSRKFEGIE